MDIPIPLRHYIGMKTAERAKTPAPPRSDEERYFYKGLRRLAVNKRISQGELAAHVGVSQGYVSKILGGKQAPKAPVRRKLAAFFGLEYNDLVTLGEEEAALEDKAGYAALRAPAGRSLGLTYPEGAPPRVRRDDMDALRTLLMEYNADRDGEPAYVETPLREAAASSGGGSTETGGRETTYLGFKTEWIRAKGNPKFMSAIRAYGDGMFPEIMDGSLVLVDENRKQFVSGKIYYLRYQGQMYIKRLVERDGEIFVTADNEDAPLAAADADDFEIIGRCIWVGRELA